MQFKRLLRAQGSLHLPGCRLLRTRVVETSRASDRSDLTPVLNDLNGLSNTLPFGGSCEQAGAKSQEASKHVAAHTFQMLNPIVSYSAVSSPIIDTSLWERTISPEDDAKVSAQERALLHVAVQTMKLMPILGYLQVALSTQLHLVLLTVKVSCGFSPQRGSPTRPPDESLPHWP